MYLIWVLQQGKGGFWRVGLELEGSLKVDWCFCSPLEGVKVLHGEERGQTGYVSYAESYFLFDFFFLLLGQVPLIGFPKGGALLSFLSGLGMDRESGRGFVIADMIQSPMDMRSVDFLSFFVGFFVIVFNGNFAINQTARSSSQVRIRLRMSQLTFSGEHPATGFLLDALVIVSGCTVAISLGGFLGLIFAERGMLLCLTPSFEEACFTLQGKLLLCRRSRHGSW